MASAPSSSSTTGTGTGGLHLPDTTRELVKILVSGPFGVGKTTLIDSVSEIRPLHTEEHLTEASVSVDNLAGVRDKTTTTVAIDFGRISLDGGIVLYLFGTPGQERFRSLWADIAHGALGALVLVDTRRIDDSFDVLGLVEESGLPYAVALNTFPDSRAYTVEQLRASLDLEPSTPMVVCDARDTNSSIDALLALVQHLIAGQAAGGPAGAEAEALAGAVRSGAAPAEGNTVTW
ncbi:GTP-binding protein [Streptomyces sp. NBC_01716]|uniref:GTP-binding protein n=1 Tax=Streptomyces sp. NBC_01716 TaxID=2975917 RepID=UPI002E377877|nr:ATP/GTP-binding protein [Streptomyces sp. NBC_01716]